jgi:hypothetical protein
MHDLHSVGLSLYQEPNHVHIHDRYFLQVQNKQGSVMLQLLFQFPEVLRLKVTNQTNRCRSTLRIFFNLQGPPALDLECHLESMQLLCQRNSLNLRSFTVQEIAEASEILIVQKNDGALITLSAEATQYGGRLEVLS